VQQIKPTAKDALSLLLILFHGPQLCYYIPEPSFRLKIKIKTSRTVTSVCGPRFIRSGPLNIMNHFPAAWSRYLFSIFDTFIHGQINLIDTKAKCCHLLKLTCKETLRQVLEIQSLMLVFSTQLCELLPLLPSLWFMYRIYRQCVAGGCGGGVELCWRPYSVGV
jgi:hypothetical protein